MIRPSRRIPPVSVTGARRAVLEGEPSPVLPEHPAYQQILAAFAGTRQPMRARDLCQALDLDIIPKNIESTRHKLKRLVERAILAEPEPVRFSQPRP